MTSSTATATCVIDGREVAIAGHRNLLEAIRASGVDLPTFCYHSELSVHGACRLCVVEIEGRGVQASCTVAPEPGMVVRTQTPQLRRLRRTTLELLLANHEGDCATCGKSGSCRLQDLALRLGASRGRFTRTAPARAADRSSPALHRDPGKCILCGDCVRVCDEVQGIGALDFAFRGERTVVQPAFGRPLAESDCVHCGQCSRVCPTGALLPADDVERAWELLSDPRRRAVVQVAPAVRVALAEALRLPPQADALGLLAAALRRLGAARVFDTAFTADLTVLEEGHEFIRRLRGGGPLPMFTSCCPAWVACVEKHLPDWLPHLSTCKSPQQMLGALLKRQPDAAGLDGPPAVLSIMPCTAKKFEAVREEFARSGDRDVDLVLTTQEAARLIAGAGLDLAALDPEPADLPFGLKTGAGLLFGASGGVATAVLRYASATLGDGRLRHHEFRELRAGDGVRFAEAELDGRQVRVAAVSGLAAARRLLDDLRAGRVQADLVEVMACPGGCVGGAGQPADHAGGQRARRAQALAAADRSEVMRMSAENPAVARLYDERLGAPGSHAAEELLHTAYRPRRRLGELDLLFTQGERTGRLLVLACLGTGCHLRGGPQLVQQLIAAVEARGLQREVEVRATFCLERCGEGPNVRVGSRVVEHATVERVLAAIDEELGRA